MTVNLEAYAESSGTEDNDIMAVAPQTSEDEQIIVKDYLGERKIAGGEGAGGENSKTGHTRKTNTRTFASETAKMLCSKNGTDQALNANECC